MFKLLKTIKIFGTGTLRLGTYSKNRTTILTPTYFFISNFGGGGTNVSRFITYMDLFSSGESQLLLNYYYLNVDFKKILGFDLDELTTLKSKGDIMDFFEGVRKRFIAKGKSIPGYTSKNASWNPELLLDSGSGNIFRDLIKEGKLSAKNFKEIYDAEVKKYLAFGEEHNFDILVAMDVAPKYTQKQGEQDDASYKSNLSSFKSSNNDLLKITLDNITDKNKLLVYAPIHGTNPQEYETYVEGILLLEKKLNKKFSGFAIGGLGNLSDRTSYDICKIVRNKLTNLKDYRPIHVLGAGSVKNIIPMSILGVDSFDCHSPWRRASEGKYITPLINSNGKIVTNKSNFWRYESISIFPDEDFTCDCLVCKSYSLNDLKGIYKKGSEYAYFAKILFFKHNISQQEFTLKAVRDGKLDEIIKDMPKSKYKEFLTDFISTIT